MIQERIAGGFDAVDARDRVENDVALFGCIVGNDRRQRDGSEMDMLPVFRPLRGRVVDHIALAGNLDEYFQLDRILCDSLRYFIEEIVAGFGCGFGGVEKLVALGWTNPEADGCESECRSSDSELRLPDRAKADADDEEEV
jgi:hypothetical protein